MSEHLLSVRNIETYYGPVMAIRGVSFDVEKGAIVTLLGANGAGKTTILKTVSGVMDPQKGSVEFEGRAIHGINPDAAVRLGISHVPEGREVFPFMTVQENLAIGSYVRNDRLEVQEDLRLVYDYFPSLRKREGQPAAGLSGGEQQMLAIGRAMMARPKLMLLDEPSLGLSPRLMKEIFTIIRRINQEQGTTILLVEQNANTALATADFGYVLEMGRIVLGGRSDELREQDDVKEFYLGVKGDAVRGTRRWKRRKTWR
ncbi:ABC transporter ATP-binding protein [Variovorax sp. VNK109]|uniref:ABC transporter ATP-binding protein n=1 Tax=Variovorax sp. VNK109 TaxID=3400919 RepID=UPI003C0642DD